MGGPWAVVGWNATGGGGGGEVVVAAAIHSPSHVTLVILIYKAGIMKVIIHFVNNYS